ncbi:hypothetical protein [Acinetobacter larvae]|uniref:hypothetical protein n=1 Tax=Acinetobacter larvae TaxID=1789224 RepID=UPI00081CE6AC|nr:hypothetical protein [Acinetobacter larvae]
MKVKQCKHFVILLSLFLVACQTIQNTEKTKQRSSPNILAEVDTNNILKSETHKDSVRGKIYFSN